MSNTLLNAPGGNPAIVIAKEALMQLENALGMANNVHREYKKEFVKIGDTVTIRKPVKFRAKDGATLDAVDVLERSTSVVINKRKHVAWKFTSAELSLTIEEYSKRYIQPAMGALANQVDVDGLALYQDVHNCVGTPGTTPASFAAAALAARRLDDEAVPQDARKLVLNSAAAWAIAGGQIALYNPQIVKETYQKGTIGPIAGFDAMMDQNVNAHTVGAHGGTPLMVGTTAEGATSIATDGWTASTTVLKVGDVFTIAGVYAVNPVSGISTGVLRQFVVTTADVTSAAGGTATINISPTIYSSAASETYLPYQTVNALPADNAAITVMGTAGTQYPQNLAFHKNAFGLVTVPIELPDGAAFKARESYNGLSVRVVKDYDITNDEDIIRLDIMYGWKTLYSDLACRLVG